MAHLQVLYVPEDYILKSYKDNLCLKCCCYSLIVVHYTVV